MFVCCSSLTMPSVVCHHFAVVLAEIFNQFKIHGEIVSAYTLMTNAIMAELPQN